MTMSDDGIPESTDWRDRFETTTSYGEVFPEPGDWWLNESTARAVVWEYDIPRTEDGDPDYGKHTWDTTEAMLYGDFGEPIEQLEFSIDHETVFTVDIEERGEGRSHPWTRIEPVWQPVAEALHYFHIDEDYTLVDCQSLVGRQDTTLEDYNAE